MHLWPLRERPRAMWEMPRRGMRVRSVREAEALTAIDADRFWEDWDPVNIRFWLEKAEAHMRALAAHG